MTVKFHNTSVQSVEHWARATVQKIPFATFKDAVIGVDASHYLDIRLNGRDNEPLINALGGTPYSLQRSIEQDVRSLKKHDITLIFVFDGLDFVNKTHRNMQSPAAQRAHENAWQHYLGGDPEKPLDDFAAARYPVETLYRYFQKLLTANDVQFIVAPYSATAQLSYIYRHSEQLVDVVMSSADSFLFDTDKIITGFEIKSAVFECLTKSACQDLLDRAPEDLFRSSQLLLGSSYLPMFPPLQRASAGKPSIRDAFGLLLNAGRSIIQLCRQYQDDAQVQALHYAENYKKALMTIRHHVVLKVDGTVAPLDFDHAPGDVHVFVGQRLPEELFFYISKGMLGSQVPNWLTSGEVVLSLPGSVIDTPAYRQLIVQKLHPLRTEAMKLMSESLNRYYHSRVVDLKLWYDRNTSDLEISMKDKDTPGLKSTLGTWKVREHDLPHSIREGKPDILPLLSLLKDASFARKTRSKQDSETATAALKSPSEVLSNVLWRFLQARGYLNDKHELTVWGKTLETTLTAMKSVDQAEELGLVAVELLRHGAFHATETSGATAASEASTITSLITRIACLGRLKHESKGFSGPLDRQLLSFAWMITAVRSTLRDLVEIVLVCMCLNGEVDRDRSDWTELAQSLPFGSDNGCGHGILARTYLDEVCRERNMGVDNLKTKIKKQQKPYQWFNFVIDYEHNLESAFKLWDAVYAGSQAAGKEFKDAKLFADANKWLASQR